MEATTDERLAGTRQRKANETPEDYAFHVRRERAKVDEKADLFDRLVELVRQAGVIMPDVYCYDFQARLHAQWDCPDREAFRAVLRALGSTIDNPWQKHSSSGSYRMTRSVDGLDLTVRAAWVTCEQVQVGTEVKTTTEVVQPAQTREVVSEVAVYEWRCPDSILLDSLEAGADEIPAVEVGR